MATWWIAGGRPISRRDLARRPGHVRRGQRRRALIRVVTWCGKSRRSRAPPPRRRCRWSTASAPNSCSVPATPCCRCWPPLPSWPGAGVQIVAPLSGLSLAADHVWYTRADYRAELDAAIHQLRSYGLKQLALAVAPDFAAGSLAAGTPWRRQLEQEPGLQALDAGSRQGQRRRRGGVAHRGGAPGGGDRGRRHAGLRQSRPCAGRAGVVRLPGGLVRGQPAGGARDSRRRL
ncbi:hypothetical protein ACU4GD_18730 [Cupriavidus basilensis]